ncbi:hypothetical protein TWF696_005615 [Orbilia brochopaga]|uniref:Uncharacterized protein n=1 Tax=Orbilia brochopaga TaxID=3140254 RepID=A0AAV9V553_9PEZI
MPRGRPPVKKAAVEKMQAFTSDEVEQLFETFQRKKKTKAQITDESKAAMLGQCARIAKLEEEIKQRDEEIQGLKHQLEETKSSKPAATTRVTRAMKKENENMSSGVQKEQGKKGKKRKSPSTDTDEDAMPPKKKHMASKENTAPEVMAPYKEEYEFLPFVREMQRILDTYYGITKHFSKLLADKQYDMAQHIKTFWVFEEPQRIKEVPMAKGDEASLRLEHMKAQIQEALQVHDALFQKCKEHVVKREDEPARLDFFIEGLKLKTELKSATAELFGRLTMQMLESKDHRWDYWNNEEVYTLTEDFSVVDELMAQSPEWSEPYPKDTIKTAEEFLAEYRNPDVEDWVNAQQAINQQAEEQKNREELFRNRKAMNQKLEENVIAKQKRKAEREAEQEVAKEPAARARKRMRKGK